VIKNLQIFYKKSKPEIFYNEIKSEKKSYISLFFTIITLAFVELFIIGSLFPIVNLFQDKEKVLDLKESLSAFFNIELSFNTFAILIFLSVIILFLLSSILQSLSFYFSSKVTEKIFFSWKNKILKKYLKQDLVFFSNFKTGDLIQKILVHTREASSFVFEFFILCKDLIISITIYIFLLFVSVKYTILFSFIFLLILLISLIVARNIVYKKSREVALLQEKIFSAVNNIIISIKVIKSFGKEWFFENKAKEINQSFMQHQIMNETLVKIPAIFNRTLTFIIAMIIMLFLVLNDYNENFISVFLVFLAGMYKINNSLGSINNSILGMARLFPNIEIVFKELKINEKSIAIQQKKNNIDKFKNKIELKNINFSYGEKEILNNISIDIAKGQHISFVGESGSGKSTLVDILCGFLQPKTIDLTIDGKKYNIKENKFINNFFGYLPQEGFIFPGTIKENITFFSDQVSETRIIESTKITGIDVMVREYNDGLNFYVSEYGKNLSGGQKQRISLARMLCSEWEILILDESTSNLDKISEINILTNLKEWLKNNNKTLITVTHSKNIAVYSDKIFVISSGIIEDCGDHQELLKTNYFYKKNFEN